MLKNKLKLALLTVLILAPCFALFMLFIISGFSGSRSNVIMFDDVRMLPIKSNDEYSSVFNAENILQSGTNSPVDLKSKLAEKKFKEEFYSLIYPYFGEIQSSEIFGENGCYLSVCGASVFDVPSNRTTGSVQCFIFTEDLEEAGTIYFNNNGRYISVSINDTAVNTRSAVFKKLSENQNKSYVILNNGMDKLLLDEENSITNVSSSRHKLEISGDCYDALKDLSISYNEITDKENLIWFQFDDMK